MTDTPMHQGTVQGPIQVTVGICNQRGLHARASAKFVKLASSFESEIRVTRDGVTVDARSIMGLLMLGAGIGCGVDIEAQGPDAAEAIEALSDLVARKFDEDQ
ncbi:HPr family phosphocarrier protein [Brevundimonas sp. P7753]|uniref:HPr family phosphocarrier protein n=1 Tax=Brevundimonas sp. P7753 TaxID=2726982 RepID=UPI0021073379|nr:HPr family phosphocarrier protein [Brevundimonas sp. P7753]